MLLVIACVLGITGNKRGRANCLPGKVAHRSLVQKLVAVQDGGGGEEAVLIASILSKEEAGYIPLQALQATAEAHHPNASGNVASQSSEYLSQSQVLLVKMYSFVAQSTDP